MSEFTADTLQQITVEALERTAFVLVDPCEAGETETPTIHAKVRFTGPSEGDVFVSASEGFLRELASSLLGVEPDEVDVQAQGMDAIREVGPGGHYLGCAHTQANYQSAFWRSDVLDYKPFETWAEEGARQTETLAAARVTRLLTGYQQPALDPGIAEALNEYVARKKAAVPDAFV